MQLQVRDIKNMTGIDQRLQKIISETAKVIDIELPGYGFIVTCGLRTIEEQKILVSKGLSKTMNSYHLTGKAFDIAVKKNGVVTWDIKEYKTISVLFKKVAKAQGIELTWGGDWKTFVDGPHFQIN